MSLYRMNILSTPAVDLYEYLLCVEMGYEDHSHLQVWFENFQGMVPNLSLCLLSE